MRWPVPVRNRDRPPQAGGWLKRRGVVELAAFGAALSGAGAVGLLGAGDRPLQAGGDLGGVDLGDGALVALGGLPGAGLEPADHHGAVALAQGLSDVLGLIAPDIDAEEVGLPIAPGLALADATVDRQAEVCHGDAVVGEPKLGVVGEVADLDGEVVAAHSGLQTVL